MYGYIHSLRKRRVSFWQSRSPVAREQKPAAPLAGQWLEDRIYSERIDRRPRRIADVVRAMNERGFAVSHHDLQRWIAGAVPPVGVARPLAESIGVELVDFLEVYEAHWIMSRQKLEMDPPLKTIPADVAVRGGQRLASVPPGAAVPEQIPAKPPVQRKRRKRG